MFEQMLIQLENAKEAVYEKEICRIYLMQAYQTSLLVRQEAKTLPQAKKAKLVEALAEFDEVEKDILHLLSLPNHTDCSDLKVKLDNFIIHNQELQLA